MSGLSIGPRTPSLGSPGSTSATAPAEGSKSASETVKPGIPLEHAASPASHQAADQVSSLSTRSIRTGSDPHIGMDAEREKVRTAFVSALKEKYGQSISDAVARHMVTKLSMANASDKNTKIASEIAQHVVEILKARKAGINASTSNGAGNTQVAQNPLDQHKDQVLNTQRSIAQTQIERHQGVLQELQTNLASTQRRLRELNGTGNSQANSSEGHTDNDRSGPIPTEIHLPKSINVREMARLYDQERELTKRIDQETALLAASLERLDRLNADASGANSAAAAADQTSRPRANAISVSDQKAPVEDHAEAAQAQTRRPRANAFSESNEKAPGESNAAAAADQTRRPRANAFSLGDASAPAINAQLPAAQVPVAQAATDQVPAEVSTPPVSARQLSESENSLTQYESERTASKALDLDAQRAALKPTKTNAHKEDPRPAEPTEAQRMQEAIFNKARQRSESEPR